MSAILSSMANSSAPTISPIKSFIYKWSRDLDSPETVIPGSKGSSLQETKNISDRGHQNHLQSTSYAENQTSQMQKVITSPEGTRKELYMPIRFTIQAETTYTCCTVRQRISDQLGPERSPSQCRTIKMLKIKQQKKNLHVHVTANNEAIQAQQQLLQDLYPHWSAEFPGNQKLCCQQKGWRMVFTSIREHAEHWDFFASTSRDKKLIFLCE